MRKKIFKKNVLTGVIALSAFLTLGGLTSCGAGGADKAAQQGTSAQDSSQDSDAGSGESTEEMSAEEQKKQAEAMVGKNVDELIDTIGEPDQKTLSPSCETKGEDGVYEWEGFTVYTQSEEPDGEQIIQEVR